MAHTAKRPTRRRTRRGSLVAEPGASQTTATVIEDIRRGYSWPLAHKFQGRLELNDAEFASFLGVSSRTLSRWRKSETALDKVASDRLYRIMRVIKLAGEVLEDHQLGLQWLRRPQMGLGGGVPLALLDTEPGFEAVEALLQQIEYGAVS